MTTSFQDALNHLPPPFDVLSACFGQHTQELCNAGAETGTSPSDSNNSADPERDAAHLWSAPELMAVAQAWASSRPLLVRGEAGCGKSQLAKALALALQVNLLHEVVHPRFEATDLLYRQDHVKRLAKAQVLSAMASSDSGRRNGAQHKQWLNAELREDLFVQHGVLLKAYELPQSSNPSVNSSHSKHPLWPRAVVLIDEIDKADVEVPNALLQVLGDRCIDVPGRAEKVRCDMHRPLIIITTNEDREMPTAFVRRCAVLNIKPPTNDEDFVEWLVARARVHPKLKTLDSDGANSILRQAAQQVLKDRIVASAAHLPTVGLAEYIDLLYALFNLAQGDPGKAKELLQSLAPFALLKHKSQDQTGGDTGAISP